MHDPARRTQRPSAEGVPRGDALVNAFNAAIGAGATQPVPGTTATGAFSFCQALASTIDSTGLPYDIVLPVGATRTPATSGFAPIR